MRRFSRWSPRRRFGGRRFGRRMSVGTTTPRMQVEQIQLYSDFVAPPSPDPYNSPIFAIQAIAPWSNLSVSGYDRNFVVRGIVFNFEMYQQAHEVMAGGLQPGPYVGARAFSPIAAWWFVDSFDAGTQAPVSFLAPPYGPFVATPPLANPDGGNNDSQVFPTRILKRKAGLIKTATPFGNSGVAIDRDTDSGGYSSFRWSGTIRKRFACDDRQALYFGIFVSPSFTVKSEIDIWYTWQLNGALYYQLRR